jgi:hypothetical protein
LLGFIWVSCQNYWEKSFKVLFILCTIIANNPTNYDHEKNEQAGKKSKEIENEFTTTRLTKYRKDNHAKNRQTEQRTDKQADRTTHRQTEQHTDRQTNVQADKQTK